MGFRSEMPPPDYTAYVYVPIGFISLVILNTSFRRVHVSSIRLLHSMSDEPFTNHVFVCTLTEYAVARYLPT